MPFYDRELNRLKNYDYSQPGYYFVTICTENHKEYFGGIKDGEMLLNKYGQIAKDYWLEIPKHYRSVELDGFVVMPNHLHGIIIINERTERCSVPTIIKSFKEAVVKDLHKNLNDYVFRWQRSFYDHVIRKDESLDKIREYIANNPLKWELDRNKPENLWM